MKKTNIKQKIVLFFLALTALAVAVFCFYFFKEDYKKGVDNFSRNDINDSASESIDSPVDDSRDNKEENNVEYISEIYDFQFNFTEIAVSWSSKSYISEPIIYISAYQTQWSDWERISLSLNNDSRGTTFSSSNVSLTGNKVKYKYIFSSNDEYIKDLSIVVAGNGKIDDIFVREVRP